MLPLLLVAQALAAPPSVPDGVVRAVRVEGVAFTEREVVLAGLDVGLGSPLKPEAAERMVEAVFATGLYDDVLVRWEPHGDGIELIVTVSERPVLHAIHIEGARKVSADDLRDELALEPWVVLDPHAVDDAAEAMRQHYVDAGFWLARVTGTVVDAGRGSVDVRFVIDEGDKVRVERIDFDGNEALPDATLRRSMATRQGGLLPGFTGRGTYRPEELELDHQRLVARYWEEGHLDAVVHPPEAHLSVDERAIFVRFRVEEGRRYTVGEVALDGALPPGLDLDAGEPMDVVRQARALQGERFQLSRVQQVAEQLRRTVGDRGYAFASVDPVPYKNARTGIVDLHFAIDPGEPQRVRHLHIVGNDPTFDRVIRRAFAIHESERWHSSRIEQARADLLALDWFDRVEVEPVPTGTPGEVDLRVAVSEKPVQHASGGISSDSLGGLGATGNYQSRNLFGTGLSGGASVNWAKRDKSGSVSLYDPSVLDSPWSAGVSVSGSQQQLGLAERSRGASLSVGRALDPRRRVRLTARLSSQHREVLGLDPYQERLFGGDLFRTGWTNEVGLALSVDHRNGQLHPTRGWYASVGAGLAGGLRTSADRRLELLGGDVFFAEATANLRLYQPLLEIDGSDALVLRFNSRLGVRRSTDGRMIPWVQRYRLGGPDSIRGYRPWTVGPSLRTLGSEDPVHADEPLTVGGTAQWINNLELEANVLPRAGIAVVGFVDAGQATGDPWGKGMFDPAEMRWSAGVGVRWLSSPLGPIRLELGVPLNPADGVRKPAAQLGFGVNF